MITFDFHNLSGRTMALGFNQNITEMSTINLPGEKERLVLKAETSPPSMSKFSRKCGILYVSQPYRPLRPATGIVLPYFTSQLMRTKIFISV
jgi:hypothetical protein